MQRQDQINQLKTGRPFDLTVVGGGATGCGIALDAATRGLKVALIEKNDFAEGTSSRSTKLVHGGVRYLEMAVRKLDRLQYNLVKESLRERAIFLNNAKHLSRRLPLVTPLYRWLDVPYVYTGLKVYDVLSGKRNIGRSSLLSRKQALQHFPMLKEEGLKAGVLYYDGQFHDARMALSLALSALQHGATIANHVSVSQLIKEQGKIIGVELTDSINGERWRIKSKGVINATGPFVDEIRRLDDPAAQGILSVSAGIHIVLDKRFAPPETGLMIPETEDGRVLFVLPWEGHALIGTTEDPADIVAHPKPLLSEIEYLVHHVTRYFNLRISKSDIKAVWSGLRPLASAHTTTDTAQLARDHVILTSPSNLLTIAGGKWTTYRKMALEAVDHAIILYGLKPEIQSSQTENLPIVGSLNYKDDGDSNLVKQYGLEADIAYHLHHSYGDQAWRVAELASEGYQHRLIKQHPFIEAEVVYGACFEFAERAIDMIARRMSLALLDTHAAHKAVPRVIELMGEQLNWDSGRCAEETALVAKRLSEAI